MARHSANSIVEWDNIRALMVCRLIALDKCPGICPIGIGEQPRRIFSEVIAMVTCMDVEELCGVDQFCTGLKAGVEGAAMPCGSYRISSNTSRP